MKPKIMPPSFVTNVLSIFEREGVPAMICGGAVRDSIVGITPKDWDIATPMIPSEVQRVFGREFTVLPTGIEHGTVTVMVPDENRKMQPVEITTLRKDVETDGRRAVVAFTTSFIDDSYRRDFTYNAMYWNPLTGEFFDFHGGCGHLESESTIFVGNADQRIEEDYLRIFRYYRFFARFATKNWFSRSVPQSIATDAIERHIHGIQKLSGERIWSEIMKLVSACSDEKSRHMFWTLMEVEFDYRGIWEEIGFKPLPESRKNGFNNIGLNSRGDFKVESLATEFLFFLEETFENAEDVLRNRLKVPVNVLRVVQRARQWRDRLNESSSTPFAQRFRSVHNERSAETTLRYLVNFRNEGGFAEDFLHAHFPNMMETGDARLGCPEFPLRPQDLIDTGLSGKAIGEALEQARWYWCDTGCGNSCPVECKGRVGLPCSPAGFPDRETLVGLFGAPSP